MSIIARARIFTHPWYPRDAEAAAARRFPGLPCRSRHAPPERYAEWTARVGRGRGLHALWSAVSSDNRRRWRQSRACGWLTGRFGVRWQVVPARLDALMGDADAVRAQRVLNAVLRMVKLDFVAREAAYRG